MPNSTARRVASYNKSELVVRERSLHLTVSAIVFGNNGPGSGNGSREESQLGALSQPKCVKRFKNARSTSQARRVLGDRTPADSKCSVKAKMQAVLE